MDHYYARNHAYWNYLTGKEQGRNEEMSVYAGCRQSMMGKARMRRSLVTTLGIAMCGQLICAAYSNAVESLSSALTEPRLEVPVRISVVARKPTIEFVLPSVTGEIATTAEFGVEGNTPRALMFVEATALYFKGDVDNLSVAPIPLHVSAGVEIDAQGATVENQAGTKVSYVGSGDVVDRYPTKKTGDIVFKSSDPYTFVHPVFVTLTWLQEDPNKPAGQYKGKVKLTCMALAPP